MAVIYPLEFHRRSERQWQHRVKASRDPGKMIKVNKPRQRTLSNWHSLARQDEAMDNPLAS
jgi:hypothetical protein